jgi:hypothetical protein
VLEQAVAAVRPALRAFVATAVIAAGLTLALAVVCYAIAARGEPLRGVLAALIAVALAIPAGTALAWRRALTAGVLRLVGQLGVAGRVVTALLDRVGLERAAASIPLAEAERRLREAVARHAPGKEGGRLRAAIERRLLGAVERVTLSRFRDQATGDGAVELDRVRDDLVARADALVAERIEGAFLGSTLLVAAGAAGLGLAAALVLRVLP